MNLKNKKSIAAVILLAILCSILFVGEVEAKEKKKIPKAKKKYYTELVLDYKLIKIPVPDKNFLTDGLNYSLHYTGKNDRWAVQTSLFTRLEDAKDPDFQPAQKFDEPIQSGNKTYPKLIKIGNRYSRDYRLKGLSYEITVTFTEKYKKFFFNLKEKDFLIEKDRGKEFFQKRMAGFFALGYRTDTIEKNVLKEKENLDAVQSGEKLKKAEKIATKYKLTKAYPSDVKEGINRQKAGILLAESLPGESLSAGVLRMNSAYSALGYQPVLFEKNEKTAYLTFKKGKQTLSLILVYEARQINKETGEEVPGTDKTLVYAIKKPL